MNRGVVEQIAGAEEVYERPATTFVAGVIGVSNLMPGVVEATGAQGRVRLDVGPQVSATVGDGIAVGDRCHAVVRPEKLQIDSDAGAVPSGHPSVEGEVESSVYLGTATQIVVRLGGDVRMTVLVPNADEELRQRLPGGGARVRLSWAPEHIHVVRGGSNEQVETVETA
jgi:spermidine/putrescine transport system ATP-binding protein